MKDKIKARQKEHNKEYDTETLINVNKYEPDIADSPAKSNSEMSRTHSYDAFEAVRDFSNGKKSQNAGSVPKSGSVYVSGSERIAATPNADSDLKSPAQEAVNPKPPEIKLYASSSTESEKREGSEISGDIPDAGIYEDKSVKNSSSGPVNSASSEETKEFEEFKELEPDFEPTPITPDDNDYDEIMEQFISSPTKPKFWFEEFGDYWSCSCGHINKGDICTNCGLSRELLRSVFVLHKPCKNPGEYQGMTAVYKGINPAETQESKDKKNTPAKKSSKGKLILAIIIVLILLACAGLFSYYYVIKPSMEEEAAREASANAKALSASIVECASGFDDFLWHSYVTAGNRRYKKEKYSDAIDYYRLAKEIKNTDNLTAKIRKSKYQYVKAHYNEGGEKFEKYLSDLHEIGYSDIDSIYYQYYAWHISIVANTSEDDYSTDIDTVSRKDTVYFHVSCSGGPPGETLDLYYEAEWPSGSSSTEDIGKDWTSGSKDTARFQYPIPLMGKEGKFKFKVYNKSTKELMAEDSVKFKK